VDGVKTVIKDDKTNGDNFWWAPNTTIKDAGSHDVLKFYGLTLTGGVQQGGVSTLSKANIFAGGGPGLAGSAHYYDHLFPFMGYIYQDGDLYVVNLFDKIGRALLPWAVSSETGAKLDALSGAMKIDNFNLRSSTSGWAQFGLGRGVLDAGGITNTESGTREPIQPSAWPERPFHWKAMRYAANDDESCACIVGNRRVWCGRESGWGVAA
jgi:hypothetical protein